MKILMKIMIILILGVIMVPLIGCGSDSEEAEPEIQIATVQKGNLTVDITAAGNLALSLIENMAFEISGTVEEVLVEEGDTVAEGQVLARLDTSEWEDQIKILENALSAAERQVTTRERALETAERQVSTKERALAAAERQVTTEELDLQQVQIGLETAEYNLSTIEEIREIQEIIDDANYQLQFIEMKISESLSPAAGANDYQYWKSEKTRIETIITDAQQEMNVILSSSGLNITTEVAIEIKNKQLAVETAQVNLEAATQAIVDAQIAVDDARVALEYAQMDVADAEMDLDDAYQDMYDAQETLDEASAASPEIIAPFDGFITKVNVEGGDEVLKGTVAVQLADPNKFEADILVSEMDIIKLELGAEALVEVDALQGMSLPATVTRIAPTATIQSGVVNYAVKVEIKSMEAFVEQAQDVRQRMMENFATGKIPERLQQAIDEGRMTEEQAREMMERMQSGDFAPPEGLRPPPGSTPPQGNEFPRGTGGDIEQETPVTSQVPLGVPEDFQLREGLTVTVTIILDQRTDVLLVPNAAITQEGFQTYVEVVSASGETEKRAVETGASDWQFTEIINGLSEGEQVMVPQGTVTTIETQQRPPGMMFFGRGPR